LKISRETIKLVKDSVDIVGVVSDYVKTLKKSGKNWVGLCPFHNDKKPSFSVSEDYKIYKCFSCGETGDVLKFVEKIEGITFVDSVVLLAKRAGIVIDVSGEGDEYTGKRNDIILFNTRTAKLFNHFLLEKNEGKVALDYLTSRGIDNDIIQIFNLGYAPKEYGRLENILLSRGLNKEILIDSGLFSVGERGLKTLLFDRVVFPIYNYMNECVGFGGRVLNNDVKPKYLNTSETVVYKKSQLLYGINVAKDEMRKTGISYLVEGYVDVIACYKNGIKNVVAPCGTAVTTEQVKLLSRFSSEIILLLDGDSAGLKGAFRALKEGANLDSVKFSVILLPDEMDPDDYFNKYGVDEFKNIVNNRIDAFDFCVNYVTKGVNLKDYNKLVEVLKYLFDYIYLWENIIVRDLLIEKMSALLGINKESLLSEFNKYKGFHNKNDKVEEKINNFIIKPNTVLDDKMKLELDLLIYLHSYTDSLKIIDLSGFDRSFFYCDYTAQLYDKALNNNFSKENFIEGIDNGTVLDYITGCLMSERFSEDEKLLKECIIDLMSDIMKQFWKRKSDQITEKIKLSEMYKDYELIADLQLEKELVTGNMIKIIGLQELKK